MFKDRRKRDLVMAGSVNLAYEVGPDRRPTAGTRLEIPPELKGTFRLFTRFGTRLRARHGEGTKRHIKFDDFKGSLVTNVKLPGDENWTRVTPQMAKDDLEASMREEDSRNQARLAAKLVPGPRERLALPQPGARPGVRGRQAPMNSAAPSGKRPRWSGPAAKTSLGYPIDGAYSEDEEEDNDNDDSAPLSDSADQINHEKDHNCARLLLTNARSLLPKEDSLVDAFQSLDLHCAGITETWFRGGKALRERLHDLEDSKGIKIIHKSRDGRKSAGGGVTFAFNKNTCNFKGRSLAHASRDQEMICAVGKVGKLQRLVVVFVVYIPPAYNTANVVALKETLGNEIASVRAALKDPIVFVCGDFNRRDISLELATVGNLAPLETGPTKGDAVLDLIFTNERGAVKELRVLPPLQSAQGSNSDHKCVFAEIGFKRERNYSWVVKMRRLRTGQRGGTALTPGVAPIEREDSITPPPRLHAPRRYPAPTGHPL